MDRPSTLPSFDPTPSGSTFSETIEYKLEIIPPYSIIQCRRADIVLKDGAEIARGYHRTVYTPGQSVATAPAEVQKVAGVLWTSGVVSAYEASFPEEETSTMPSPVESGETVFG